MPGVLVINIFIKGINIIAKKILLSREKITRDGSQGDRPEHGFLIKFY
jgi:hypothetical protein